VQGIVLFVVGMALLFLSMGIIILSMIILQRLFRTRKLVPEDREPGEREAVSRHERDTADEEIVAAIALALAHLRSLDIARSGLGSTLEAGPGSWWTVGQIRQRPGMLSSSPKASPPSETSETPQRRR